MTEPTNGFSKAYSKFFGLSEVREDFAVKLFAGAVLFGFFVTYGLWQKASGTTLEGVGWGWTQCWPFYQGCHDLVFLRAFPYGYSQTIIYMLLFGLIFLGVYALLVKKYVLAHLCILILFAWKVYILAIGFGFTGNYDYYHTAFAFIFLFVPNKRFFASLSLVLFYFLSTAVKIHEGWTLGTYFSSMHTGLPLVPDALIPFATNLVIFMEMVAAWFLFSSNKFLQRLVFAFFVFFHLYSGILVGYRYPSIVMPVLLIFFGPLFVPFNRVPLNFRALGGWALICIFIVLQSISHLIPGDEKLTMEGNRYGVYMFEANHQCKVLIEHDGKALEDIRTTDARARCDPYVYYFIFKNRYCTATDDRRPSFVIDHSVNGGPYYRIVDEPDICNLEYRAFSRNPWIKTADEAEAISRPRKNFYGS